MTPRSRSQISSDLPGVALKSALCQGSPRCEMDCAGWGEECYAGNGYAVLLIRGSTCKESKAKQQRIFSPCYRK